MGTIAELQQTRLMSDTDQRVGPRIDHSPLRAVEPPIGVEVNYIDNNLTEGANEHSALNENNSTANQNYALAPKVPNDGHATNGQRRGTITLSHLPQRPPVSIEFRQLSYAVPEPRKSGTKTILSDVSGEFHSGELTAIMGPSGAGKSTLMNILAGYKTSQISGSVLINGKERSLRRFRKQSCYIMQEDVLMPNLSVKEAMMISANLKLGKDMSLDAKRAIVAEILSIIGLKDSFNTLTCNLSGGQRKRLSIALELVNNPPVMFLDEPTSGLDSSTCFQLISLLKSLAWGGRTIICTIHQPSARLFEKFDHLYMMADGQCMYAGSVSCLVPFLHAYGYDCPAYHNPADFVLEVASGEYGAAVPKLVAGMQNGNSVRQAQLIKAMQLLESKANLAGASDETAPNGAATTSVLNEKHAAAEGSSATAANSKPAVLDIASTALLAYPEQCITMPNRAGFPTSGWTQFWILLKRSFKTILRDRMLTHMRLLSHVIVGAIIGMIYYDVGNDASKVMSNAGCIFFTTLFTMFTAMMPTILTFPNEMSVFVREHLNYWYSLKAFYFAKTLADMPFQIVFTSVYVVVVYYLTAQPLESQRLIMFVTICVLTSLVAQSLGLLIGAGMNIETGVFLGPVSTIPTILFSGFFVNLDTIPGYLQWVTYVSYVRYGFEGSMVAIYGLDRPKLQCNTIYCHFRNPKKFLEEMSMDKAEYWLDAVALLLIFFALRIAAYFVLRMKLRMLR